MPHSSASRPLDGRVAVITGASKGLGKAMALALADAGAKVALVARHREQLEETAGEIRANGGAADAYRADITEEREVEQLADEISAQLGAIHILINNAGINIRKNLADFTLAEWRQVTDTNLTGVFLMCRSFIPTMRGHGYGRILNLSSTISDPPGAMWPSRAEPPIAPARRDCWD